MIISRDIVIYTGYVCTFCGQYWAKMAKSGGILPKSVAIDLLSRLHDLPDGVYYSTALACDPDTLVALARKRGEL